MERLKAKEAADQSFDQETRALEARQLTETEALQQEQCWVETFRVSNSF